MLYILILLLVIVLIFMIVQLKIKKKQIQKLSDEITILKDQNYIDKSEMEIFKFNKELIWNYINAIHLHANIANEEAKTYSLKQRQQEIINNAEEIIKVIKKS